MKDGSDAALDWTILNLFTMPVAALPGFLSITAAALAYSRKHAGTVIRMMVGERAQIVAAPFITTAMGVSATTMLVAKLPKASRKFNLKL